MNTYSQHAFSIALLLVITPNLAHSDGVAPGTAAAQVVGSKGWLFISCRGTGTPPPAWKWEQDANFQEPLADYPAMPQSNLTRRPMYMFGPRSPIFIQIKWNAGLGTLTDRLRVKSESDAAGIAITLKETAPNSGIYRNVTADYLTGSRLYLDYSTYSNADAKYIKVLKKQELLTFEMLGDPNDRALPGNHVWDSTDVMVCMGTIGAGSFKYDAPNNLDGWDELPGTGANHDKVISWARPTALDAATWYIAYNEKGDTKCRREHFANRADPRAADYASLVCWFGHGTKDDTGYYCVFLGGLISIDTFKLYKNNVDLGRTASRWAVFNTCRFLNTTPEAEDGRNATGVTPSRDELKALFANGLDIACGWKTRMTMHHDMIAAYFVRLYVGMAIPEAWHSMARKFPRHVGTFDPAADSISRVVFNLPSATQKLSTYRPRIDYAPVKVSRPMEREWIIPGGGTTWDNSVLKYEDVLVRVN